MSYKYLVLLTTAFSPFFALQSENNIPSENKLNSKGANKIAKIAKVAIPSSVPSTLIVKVAFKQFTLTYSKKQVAITGYMMDLSLDRKKCNAHIIDRFNQDIKKIIRTNKKALLKKNSKKNIETLQVSIAGKIYFVRGRSKAGAIFLSLPREIVRMKWEERLNCEKNKN